MQLRVKHLGCLQHTYLFAIKCFKKQKYKTKSNTKDDASRLFTTNQPFHNNMPLTIK